MHTTINGLAICWLLLLLAILLALVAGILLAPTPTCCTKDATPKADGGSDDFLLDADHPAAFWPTVGAHADHLYQDPLQLWRWLSKKPWLQPTVCCLPLLLLPLLMLLLRPMEQLAQNDKKCKTNTQHQLCTLVPLQTVTTVNYEISCMMMLHPSFSLTLHGATQAVC